MCDLEGFISCWQMLSIIAITECGGNHKKMNRNIFINFNTLQTVIILLYSLLILAIYLLLCHSTPLHSPSLHLNHLLPFPLHSSPLRHFTPLHSLCSSPLLLFALLNFPPLQHFSCPLFTYYFPSST